MTLKMVISSVILGVILVMAGCSSGSGGNLPAPGRAAPDFELTSLAGQTVALSELRGSPVVLNFWATWCGPCRLEMPFLQMVHDSDAWRQEGLVVMGVNIQETAELVEMFMTDFGLTFPVLLDFSGNTARQYNISGIPATFFIDKGGIIQKIKVGAYTNIAALENDVEDLVRGDTE
ncbi:MAG: TlpA family protein disulfide reductase [Dehalococcoidales bacterium]|nr:TlpA family protein disulfide reductase [Dehalococcoidales bacterium]